MVELAVEEATAIPPYGTQNGLLHGSGIATANYQIEEPLAVAEFLRQHPFLDGLLIEARQQISHVFGQATPVELRLYDEPEYRGNPELYAEILTSLTVEESLTLQETLDQNWWLDNLDRGQGKFHIMVGFI
jgi:hypothetical protein